MGRCEGPLHSYVRMPFGLPSMSSAYHHNLRRVLAAQEARHHAVLAEMETVLREPPEPPEHPEAQVKEIFPRGNNKDIIYFLIS